MHILLYKVFFLKEILRFFHGVDIELFMSIKRNCAEYSAVSIEIIFIRIIMANCLHFDSVRANCREKIVRDNPARLP